MASDDESANERALQFRGLARVEIDDLDFEHVIDLAHRPVSNARVAQLVKVFEVEGCHRLRENNFVAGVVEGDSLAAALTSTGTTLCTHASPNGEQIPRISIPVRAVNGLHRILAARQHLDANDHWWVVRLFTSDLPLSEVVHVAEETAHEKSYCDGQIFWKIRKYHQEKDQEAENRWWCRLTETKRKDLRQLLKDRDYADAFDKMLVWPGLWDTIKLGSLHRLLTMKCKEEIQNYLDHVVCIWTGISVGIPSQVAHDTVDEQTVARLEGLAPRRSRSDSRLIDQLMTQMLIFPKVADATHRTTLSHNLCSVGGLIPSLRLFFDNLKYLEPAAKILRAVLPTRQTKSIRRAFFGSYFQPQDLVVESGPYQWRQKQPIDLNTDRSIAYYQLWLFALRHFRQMISATPRKEPDRARPTVIEPYATTWQEFSALTLRLGFKTDEARRISDTDALRQIAAQTVRSCGHREEDNEEVMASLAMTLQRLRRATCTPPRACFFSDKILSIDRRCGRPFEDDYDRDKPALFLPQMYQPLDSMGEHVTTLFCTRDMFMNFMGASFDDVVLDLGPPVGLGALQVASEPRSGTSQCRCEALQGQLESCRQLLSSAESRCRGLESAKAEQIGRELTLTAKLQEYKRKMDTSEERIEALRAQLESSRQNLSSMADRCGALETASVEQLQREATLKDKLNEYQQKTAASEERIRGYQIQIEDLQAAVDTAKSSLDLSKPDLEDRNRRFEELREKFERRVRESEEINQELVQSRAEIATLQGQLTASKEEIAVQASRHENDLRSLQASLDSGQSEIAKAEEANAAQIRNLEQRLASLRVELDSERDRVSQTEMKLYETGTKLSETEMKLNEQLEKFLREDVAHQTFLREHNSAIKRQRTMNEKLQGRFQEAQQELDKYRGIADQRAGQITDFERETHSLQADIQQLTSIVDRQEDKQFGVEVQLLNRERAHHEEIEQIHKEANALAAAFEELQRDASDGLVEQSEPGDESSITLHFDCIKDGKSCYAFYSAPASWARFLVQKYQLCSATNLERFAYLLGPNSRVIPATSLKEDRKKTQSDREEQLARDWVRERWLTVCSVNDFRDKAGIAARTLLRIGQPQGTKLIGQGRTGRKRLRIEEQE